MMSTGRHVTMLTEGTYPLVHGGVSTWCDQLVKGMPEVEFNVVSLSGNGREPVTWELPRNVYQHTSVPLWGTLPGSRRAPRGPARRRFIDTYERFLLSFLDPEAHCDFGEAFYELARLARDGRLSAALRTEAALRSLMWIWTMPHLPIARGPPHRARRADRDRPAGARAAPAGRPAARGLRLTRHRKRPGHASGPGRTEVGRHPVPAHRARHLSARALPRLPQRRTAMARQGPDARLLPRAQHPRLQGGRPDHPVQPVQPPLGGARRRRPATRSVPSTTASTPPPSRTPGPSPTCPRSPGAAASTPSRTSKRCCARTPWCVPNSPRPGCGCSARCRAGGEAYKTRLEKLAAELGVTDGLTFEGRISEVWRAYAAGHVVMLSSISEGFPFSIIEAMSCGRTTVSTDVGGVSEAVGDTGLVVPPREPEKMAAAALSCCGTTNAAWNWAGCPASASSNASRSAVPWTPSARSTRNSRACPRCTSPRWRPSPTGPSNCATPGTRPSRRTGPAGERIDPDAAGFAARHPALCAAPTPPQLGGSRPGGRTRHAPGGVHSRRGPPGRDSGAPGVRRHVGRPDTREVRLQGLLLTRRGVVRARRTPPPRTPGAGPRPLANRPAGLSVERRRLRPARPRLRPRGPSPRGPAGRPRAPRRYGPAAGRRPVRLDLEPGARPPGVLLAGAGRQGGLPALAPRRGTHGRPARLTGRARPSPPATWARSPSPPASPAISRRPPSCW